MFIKTFELDTYSRLYLQTVPIFLMACVAISDRIWDKVIGGSCMILVYVVVSIFLTFQYKILNIKSTDKIVAYLQNVCCRDMYLLLGVLINFSGPKNRNLVFNISYHMFLLLYLLRSQV